MKSKGYYKNEAAKVIAAFGIAVFVWDSDAWYKLDYIRQCAHCDGFALTVSREDLSITVSDETPYRAYHTSDCANID